MAVSTEEIKSQTSSGEEANSASAATVSSSPNEERSGGGFSILGKRFGARTSASLEENSKGDTESPTPSESSARASSETSRPEPASSPTPEERPTPRHVFNTDEDLRRYEQSVRDRAIESYKKNSEEESRKTTVTRYRERIKQARDVGDLMMAGELAGELQDFEDGIFKQQDSTESLKAAREDAALTATAQIAAKLDREYTTTFYSDLPKAAQEEFGKWWERESAPGADGNPRHTPDALRTLLTKKLATAYADHYRQLGRDDVLDELDKDPELRKVVIAHLGGGQKEPPSLNGTPSNRTSYRTLKEIRDAVGNEEITPQEGIQHRRRLETAARSRR